MHVGRATLQTEAGATSIRPGAGQQKAQGTLTSATACWLPIRLSCWKPLGQKMRWLRQGLGVVRVELMEFTGLMQNQVQPWGAGGGGGWTQRHWWLPLALSLRSHTIQFLPPCRWHPLHPWAELDQRVFFVFKIDCNLRKVGYKTIMYGPRII